MQMARTMARPFFHSAFFNPRRRSLLRGSVLVLASFFSSFRISGFPDTRATPLLAIPAIVATLGAIDTLRCIEPHRNLYHAGVIFCLLMDTLAICLIFFFLFFPYLF